MISVLIPAYNEIGAIHDTVTTIRSVLDDAGLSDAEILVVDDGSADGTCEKAITAGARVVRNPHNLGYGYSLKRGISAAAFDTIVITDADLTYPADQIPQLLETYRQGFDMVVGARTGKHYRESALKAPLRYVLRLMVEFAAGRKIPDINSGLRIFDRRTVTGYFSHLCNTFSFTTSMTLAYMMNGKFVTYLPIDYNARVGETKVRLFRDSLRTLQYITEAVIFFNPLKAFMLLSAVAVVMSGVSFLAAAVTSLAAPYYLGISGLFLAALILAMGFLAVLLKQIMLNGDGGKDRTLPNLSPES